jgi:hypothetical protein
MAQFFTFQNFALTFTVGLIVWAWISFLSVILAG